MTIPSFKEPNMLTRLTKQAEKTHTRKESRKAMMAGLLEAASQEASANSKLLTPPMTAWVFLVVAPGLKAHYVTSVSRFPVAPAESFPPGSELKLVAGFQQGKKVLG